MSDPKTITASALLMSLGVAPMTACGASDDSQSTTDLTDFGGADYGGPEGSDFDTDEIGETSSTDSSSSSSSSSTDTSATDTSTDTTTDTGGIGMCGWDPSNLYYGCGFQGIDPDGVPIDCPPGLAEGDPCSATGLTGAGCCDAEGNNWYCGVDAQQNDIVVLINCD